MGHQSLEDGRAVEGCSAGQQVEERAAQGVDVSAMVRSSRILGLFGGHEVDGAHVHSALGQPRAGRLAERVGGIDEAGEAEVENADRSVGIEDQVAGFHVAMNDTLGMGGREPACRLNQAVNGMRHGHGPALSNDTVEVSAFDEFHHEELDAPVFGGIERSDDVGMLEPAGCLDLAAKSHDGLVIARERWRKNLEDADLPQPAVAALEDHAHATLANLVEDDIVADQEPSALFLIDRGCLVGSELAGVHQARDKPSTPSAESAA